jgi:hypothetical protein
MQPTAQAPAEPPRPAPIQQPTLGAVAAQGQPDPFALAAEANGVREPQPRRGNSLLERVTGAGKRLMTPKEAVEPRPQPQQQQLEQPQQQKHPIFLQAVSPTPPLQARTDWTALQRFFVDQQPFFSPLRRLIFTKNFI